MCFLGGVEVIPPICLNLQESCSKVGHSARELVAVFSLTSLLVTVVGQMVKMPPPPMESVLAHPCTSPSYFKSEQ